MGAFSALLSSLALGGIAKLTAPKVPKARPAPSFDFDKETAEALAARRASEDPQLRELYDQQRKTALSLSRGELPAEVEQTLRRIAAENTTMRGLSAEQGTRLTARALGLTQLDYQKQGAELTKLVDTIRQAEWTTAADSALSKANMMFTNYANRERYRLAAWEQEAKGHTSLFSGLISGVAAIQSGRLPSRTSTGGRRIMTRRDRLDFARSDPKYWDPALKNTPYTFPSDF